ncbi:MAG: PAS domain S-box protein [Thermoanaerobaculales bacterium]|nr:PAS domain S-box protein [Thermoanaerobaculales bacterium]
MTETIRILHLEDDPIDAELAHAVLKSGDIVFEVERVETRDDFIQALEDGNFDLILADYALPSYDGLSALAVAREKHPRTPFILVSGTLGEEVAVKVLKEGATDYLLKENLSRLAPAVKRALQEAEVVAGQLRTEAERARLFSAIECSSDTVVITDAEGMISYVNPAFESISGYSREEAIGENLRVLKSGEHDDDFYAQMWQTISVGEKWAGTIINQKKDGTLYEEECTINPVFDSSGEIVSYVAVKRDVTESRKAQAALKSSEERFRLLYERNLAGVWRSTLDGRVIECNQAFAHILGFTSPEEILSEGTPGFYDVPSDCEKFIDDLRRFGRVSGREIYLLRRDGEKVSVVLSASLIDNGSGSPVIEGSMIDRTEHQRMEEKLAQVQKLEAVGELAGGIAHDFNNLLMAIMTSADLIGLRFPEMKGFQELTTIRQTVARGADLTKRLLAVARKQVLEFETLDFNSLVSNELKILRRVIPENVRIDFKEGPDLKAVKGDRGQLGQVLMNLVVNARDAMKEGGAITLESSEVEYGGETEFSGVDLQEGRYVSLSVEDTGGGMDVVTLSRIFEPFFSTKSEAEGSGLGLAIVYGIVNQHGGFIRVESAPGSGTRIDLFLPAVMDRPRDQRRLEETPRTEGTETLLVVEDEAVLRKAMASILRTHGYTVLEAEDGEVALSLIREGGPVDLVISDVIMPNMGGTELLRKARADVPELPFLFSSGYTDEALRGVLEIENGVSYMGKPYGMPELTARVRELLDRSDG